MADPTPIRRTPGALSDASLGWRAPELSYGLNFSDYGSYGLRQYSGWIKEEFLRELIGREGARTYREMMDNSSIIGAMIFTIQQAMRKVTWRVESAVDNSAEADRYAEFVDSLRGDMSHTWDDFVVEMLSMLPYGYSLHEIVYKRRLGPVPKAPKSEQERPVNEPDDLPISQYSDGLIGWRRLPIRGQETVLKWFLDDNGQITGVTQQPWVGTLIDIPIEKLLLFRPISHKNNPEGRSVLRNAYRDYYFVKRLEELEAILFERMGGFPCLYLPSELIEKAASSSTTDPDVAAAQRAFQLYKNAIGRVRVDEQMGLLLPSDPYRDEDGKMTNVRMYEFQLVTPQHGRQSVDPDKTIERHSVQMLMTLLADFIKLGHEVRGTNNLAMTRVDMFYSAIEGWLNAAADVLNRFGLTRLFKMNGFDYKFLPKLVPDMPQRLDLDSLGAFIGNIAKAGMPLFPNEELEEYVRDAAGFPPLETPEAAARVGELPTAALVKMLMGAAAKQWLAKRGNPNHDERGRFTFGSGGSSREAADPDSPLGHGYSSSAWADHKGVIHTSNVYDATRALYEDRKVELQQPKQVSTLVEHLGKVANEWHRLSEEGKEAPDFDLCNVSVSGTNLFCAESKGLPRVKMPQMNPEQTRDFIHHLEDKGYEVAKTHEYANRLRATQDELHGEKVARNMQKMIDDPHERDVRLVVSKDDYILDGHHRWAAAIALDARNDRFNELMAVSRVNIGIVPLLREANRFTGGKGKVKSYGEQGAERTAAA